MRLLDDVRLSRVRDDHVRPPGPAREARSRTAALWRFRLTLLLLLAVVVLGVVLLVRLLTGYYGADPGVETGTPSASATSPGGPAA